MLSTFKRSFLFALLVLAGLAAVVITLAVYRASRPEALTWALRGVLAEGFLCLVSFAAYTALDRPFWRTLACFGMMLSALMLLLTPIYISWEITSRAGIVPISLSAHDRVQHLVETGLLTAGLLCLIPFVLVPRMKRIGRIAQYTTVLYLTVAYHFTLMQLWQIDSQHVREAVATLLIPAGACMLGVFALHKFFEIRQADPLSAVGPAVSLCCPRCHAHQTLALGASRCSACRLKFTIVVDEPKCPNCRFNLFGLTRPICPECGLHLDEEDVPLAADVPPVVTQAA